MDTFERVKRAREEYESAMDEAETLRAAYHREVVKLHRSGTSRRDIAEQLGISHQRVHQIVGVAEEVPRRSRGKVVGGAAVVVLLVLALTAGGFPVFRGGALTPAIAATTKTPHPVVIAVPSPTRSASIHVHEHPARTVRSFIDGRRLR